MCLAARERSALVSVLRARAPLAADLLRRTLGDPGGGSTDTEAVAQRVVLAAPQQRRRAVLFTLVATAMRESAYDALAAHAVSTVALALGLPAGEAEELEDSIARDLHADNPAGPTLVVPVSRKSALVVGALGGGAAAAMTGFGGVSAFALGAVASGATVHMLYEDVALAMADEARPPGGHRLVIYAGGAADAADPVAPWLAAVRSCRWGDHRVLRWQRTAGLGTDVAKAKARAEWCGVLLAQRVLKPGALGRRPAVLIGAGLGADLVLACLEELASDGAMHVVRAVLVGATTGNTDAARRRTAAVRAVAAGALVDMPQGWPLPEVHSC